MDELWQHLTAVWAHTKVAILSFAMAMVMSMLRTKHSTGRADIIEAIMCGLLAVGIWSFLEWWHIPQSVAVGMASGIGYFGTHWFGDYVKGKLEKKS